RRLHPDLRPDVDWENQYGVTYSTIAKNLVDQLQSRNPAVPTICFITHNHYDFKDPSDPATLRLRAALEALHDACAQASVVIKPATVDSVVDAVRALPYVEEKMVLEGSIMSK